MLIDADVLGRHRTGDETYVEQLLRALPQTAPDLRIAALTRDAALVPDGVEPVILRARTQELRMAVGRACSAGSGPRWRTSSTRSRSAALFPRC